MDLPYSVPVDFINEINFVQSSWKAAVYPEYEERTYGHILKQSGYHNGPLQRPTKVSTFSQKEKFSYLPKSFDWRNVDGIDYVSPIRNQGNCGSCYAFASMAALESRIRILTNNVQKPVFSPQDVVGCSNL